MNKAMIGGGLVVALAGTAWAGGTWWTSQRAEQGLREYSMRITADPAMPVDMTVTSYERGPLTSHAVSRVFLRGAPQFAVELDHAIENGPNPAFGWTRITTTIRPPEMARQSLAYYFDGKPPLTLVTVVGFDGAARTQVMSPAFDKPIEGQPSGKVVWGGLSGTIDQPSAERTVSTLSVPRLSVDTQAGSFRMNGLAFATDWNTTGPNSLHWTGSSSFKMADAEVSSVFGRYSIQEVAFAGYQKDQGRTILAGYAITAASGGVATDGAARPLFRNAALELELAGLDRQALSDLLEGTSRLNRAELSPAQRSSQTLALFTHALEAIAAQSPALVLKRLGVETEHGMYAATGKLELGPAAVGADPKDPMAWRDRLQGRFELEVAPGLARLALEKPATAKAYHALTRLGERADPESVKAMAAEIADRQLQHLVAAGALRTKGPNYAAEIDVKGAEWFINGMTREQFMGVLAEDPAPASDVRALPPANGR